MCTMRVVDSDDLALFRLQSGALPWPEFWEAFGAFITAAVRKLGSRWLASESDREDVLQEVLLHLIEPDRPRYDPGRAAATSYLYLVVQSALHRVFDRRTRRERLAARGAGEPGTHDTNAPLAADAHAALEDAQFVAFLMRDFDDADRGLLTAVANDITLQRLALKRGVSRSTLSRRASQLMHRALVKGWTALAV